MYNLAIILLHFILFIDMMKTRWCYIKSHFPWGSMPDFRLLFNHIKKTLVYQQQQAKPI